MVKLVEGRKYKFIVEKEAVSPDGTVHFVLAGPDLQKHLIPARMYADYKITVGSAIICRVDKINCKGKIFIEPQHPVYAEGESYRFEILGYNIQTDKKGRQHKILSVKGISGTTIEICQDITDWHPAVGSAAVMKIARISKGKIYLKGEKRNPARLS